MKLSILRRETGGYCTHNNCINWIGKTSSLESEALLRVYVRICSWQDSDTDIELAHPAPDYPTETKMDWGDNRPQLCNKSIDATSHPRFIRVVSGRVWHEQLKQRLKSSITCFLIRLRNREESRKGKTRLARHGNILQTQVNYCLGSYSQSSTTFKPLQSHVDVECQVDEKLISRTLNIKISKEDIGTKECNCFIYNISLICEFPNKINFSTKYIERWDVLPTK